MRSPPSMLSQFAHQALQRVSYHGVFRPTCAVTLRTVLPATLDRDTRAALVRLIGWILHEPEHACRRILREFLYQRAIASKRWVDVMTRRVSARDVADNVLLCDEDAVRGFLQAGQRGVVVTTYHAGDYLSALLKLASLLPAGRCLHVLRRADGSSRRYNAVMPTLLPGIRVALDDGGGIRAGVRALRRGHVLAVLCDLPEGWGAAAPVRLFDRSLRWTRSSVDFAAFGRADLMPLTSHLTRSGRCVVTPHRVLPADRIEAGPFMQRLADVAESQIRHWPGQWHQWPLVPQMLDTPAPGNRGE